MEQERDRLVKQLANQADRHVGEMQECKDAEEALQAEFETQCSKWVEKEKALSAGFGEVKDLLDGKLLFSLFSCRLALQAGLRLLTFFFFP